MSNTDIVPSKPYSTIAEFSSFTQFYDTLHQRWGDSFTSKTFNDDRLGSKGRISNSTPGYAEAARTGNLPMNAFTFNQGEYRNFSGFYSYELDPPSVRETKEGTFPASFCSPPDLIEIPTLRMSNLTNEVKQKVFAKVRDSDVNIAVAWGEREETIRMLSGTLSKLGSAYNKAKHGDFLGAMAILGKPKGSQAPLFSKANAASNWLELQYGWLPLMSDIEGLCKTMHKQSRHKEYVTIRSRKSIQETVSADTPNGVFTDYTTASASYTITVQVKMRSNSLFLATASEVGLTNPLLVAWELVPFSFVVDWALPIGNFLSQFDSALGWELTFGSVTTYYKRRSDKHRRVENKHPPGYKYVTCFGTSSNEQLTVIRTPIASWPEMFTLPYVKNPVGLIHCLNALALLTSKR